MVEAASNMLKADDNLIVNFLYSVSSKTMKPKIVLVGHSLGGGVVSVLSQILKDHSLFRKDGASLECYTFGCPPCVSETLAKDLTSTITSIVNKYDVVPHLNPILAKKLTTLRIEANEGDNKSEKYIVKENKKATKQTQNQNKSDKKDVSTKKEKVDEGKGNEKPKGCADEDADLRVPGRILYIKPSGKVEALVDVTATWRPYMLLRPSMVKDHLMTEYIGNMEKIAALGQEIAL